MTNKLILTTFLTLFASNAFACQSDFDCGIGQHCQLGMINYDTQEGICVGQSEFQRNPSSVFDDIRRKYN